LISNLSESKYLNNDRITSILPTSQLILTLVAVGFLKHFLMRIKFYLSLLMLAVGLTTTAQIVTLRGKVINAKTNDAVPGASILSGSFGTSADDKGNFVFYVQQAVIEESGITVSSIGFQTSHLTDITDNYNVTLTPMIQELKTVAISPGAEYIVQKAFRQIPQNYINKGFNITGMQSMVHSVRDTFGYQYYYLNKAKVKIYMSAYADTPAVAQVGLMEKEEKIKNNPKARKVSFLDGYTLALTHDDVHLNAPMLKGDLVKFRYKLNRKELIDGRKTYVVNYYSNGRNHNAGILYIDTATYAFVRILSTKYNVKVASAVDLNKVTTFIQYRRYDDKWALDAVKFNSIADVKGYELERTEQFQVGAITTEYAAQLPMDAILKPRAADNVVIPYDGFSAADKKMPKNIQKAMDGSFQKIKIPEIADSVHHQ
jgi:hypothetical protein